MELKTARLTLLIDPNKKAAFEQLCSRLDLTPSQVVRQLIRDFLAQHDVPYTPSGEEPESTKASRKSTKSTHKSATRSASRSANGR